MNPDFFILFITVKNETRPNMVYVIPEMTGIADPRGYTDRPVHVL